jgi:hypothetical protein
MARVLDEDELVGNRTLVGGELERLSGRRGATKLGFALLLRFYAVHGRFPTVRVEIPDQAPDDLRYARRRYLTVESRREVARIIANGTFASRQSALWGKGTTAAASDSTPSTRTSSPSGTPDIGGQRTAF